MWTLPWWRPSVCWGAAAGRCWGLPWLLASLRTGLGLALSGAIVGEYLGSTQGMGWLLSAAGDVYNAQRVLCCVLVLVVIIVLLDGVVRLLERRLLRWQRSS